MSLDAAEREKLRFRCQTDLFFLAKNVLGKDLTERTHRLVTEWFVKKDPRKTIAEQSRIKERLLLYPRGSYKSTLNICDCVQWIICFPSIRILVLTGADDLATAFVDELKEYFTLGDEPTSFQQLFPELCIPTAKAGGNLGEFWLPARARNRNTKEPTVFASSILANNSGWHVDVMKADDVVTDRNTDSLTEMQRITKKFKMIRKLLMPYGYRDTVGTPYTAFDCYADHMEQAHSYEMKFGRKVLNYLWRPAWWLKGTDFQIPTVEQTENEDALELLFPEMLPYDFLRREQHADERSFNSQYLCRPVEATQITFTLDDLRKHTVDFSQLPRDPKYYVTWDFAYSTKKGRDYSVGAVGALDEQNRLYIVDVVRGRYSPDELAYHVARVGKMYHPEIIGIEDSTGARFLEMDIQRHAEVLGVRLPIEWFPTGRQPEAKEIRVKELQTMLAQNLLFFSRGIPCIDALYKEFVQFGGQHHHDDIPDAIAHLRRYIPLNIAPTPESNYSEAVKVLKAKSLRDLIFGKYGEEEALKPPPILTAQVDGIDYPVLGEGLD